MSKNPRILEINTPHECWRQALQDLAPTLFEIGERFKETRNREFLINVYNYDYDENFWFNHKLESVPVGPHNMKKWKTVAYFSNRSKVQFHSKACYLYNDLTFGQWEFGEPLIWLVLARELNKED